MEYPWDHDLILHEAGVPPIHTPVDRFLHLPKFIKKKIQLVHVSAKDIPPESGLVQAKTGMQNVIKFDIEES